MNAQNKKAKASLQRDEAALEPKSERKAEMACFKTLYESRDGGLCLFEDERGHLVAVNASKLV